MKRIPNIVEFVTDPQLLNLKISQPQETLLRSIYGMPLNSAQMDIFVQCTGRETYPTHGFAEATVVAGARAGKDSRIAAPVALYEAIYGGHHKHLSRGERGTIPLVAQDSRATRIAYGYISDYVLSSDLLSSMLDGPPLSQEIVLQNRLSVVCFPCTKSSLRGWSIPCGVLDELAFFAIEGSADSDAEIQMSVRRGMIQFPSTRLIKISTPYMRGGVLYSDFKDWYGKDSPDILVWKASSTYMNPSLRMARLEREKRLDPERYAREYLAEFTEDLAAFLSLQWIDAAVVQGRYEIAPAPDNFYIAAVDPSGGGADSFTLSIVHLYGDRLIQDVCRGWKKHRGETMNLDLTVGEISTLLKAYGLASTFGDKYSAGWVVEAFAKHGIAYLHSEEIPDKSAAYVEIEPLFATGRIEILDHAQLQKELRLLEKRPRPGGRPLIDHPRGSHDDYANALALAAAIATQGIGDMVPESAGNRTFTRDSWEEEPQGHPMDALIDRSRGRQFWN